MLLGGNFLTEIDLKDLGFKKIGENVKIHERASVYGRENISLGDNIRIDDYAVIIATGPLTLGSHVHIANYVFIGASQGVEIQDFCSIAPGVKIFTASDDYSGEKLTNVTVPREYTGGTKGKVILERHVIIGAGSIILPGCTIGKGSSVGALSLVNNNLRPWGVYFGIPVRRINDRKQDILQLEQELLRKEKHGS